MLYNEKYEALSRDELKQLQIEKLQSTLNRVYRNVAFYKHNFDAHNVNIEKIKSIEALRELPFTTREDLGKSYPYDMFAVPLREIVRIHVTPGITSTPIVVGFTRNDLRSWTECVARVLTAAGITANDVVQIAFPHNLCMASFGFSQGAEQIGASVIPSSATSSGEKQITIMKDFRTTALVCAPGYALYLSSMLEELQIHPARLHLRLGLFSGEPWSEELRAQIEERLHVKALDTYGLSAVLGPGVAGECIERSGLHINEDHFIVEVIDPRTLEPVPAGGRGELVFTTIAKEGFPIIRYRTGDITSIAEAPCPCGRTFARMEKVTERSDDRFFFRGVGIFPSQIEAILLAEEGTSRHFQIILERENGVETMEIKVEVSEDIPSMDELRRLERICKRLVKRIETVLDIPAKVTFVEPKTLRNTGEARVVDRRKK
jgi:phenylacetate-CoA ligase